MAQLAFQAGEGPDPFADRPELPLVLLRVWQGFWLLSSGRRYSDMGLPHAVDGRDVSDWMDEEQITDSEYRRQLRTLLRELDATFRGLVAERHADAHALSGSER